MSGICPNCLCCNWDDNPSSYSYGCTGLCDLNGHTNRTPREEVRWMLAAWRAIAYREDGR